MTIEIAKDVKSTNELYNHFFSLLNLPISDYTITSTEGEFSLYPATVTNELSIKNICDQEVENVKILDTWGIQVYAGLNQLSNIDVSMLKEGMYTIIINTLDNQKVIRRFMKS